MTRPLIVKRETKNEESAWAGRVKRRDEHTCRFERNGATCFRHGTDAAHIYRRHQCGKAKFADQVGITACRECHNAFDAYSLLVRVPIERLRAAWDSINAVSKVNTIGERP